MSENLASDPKLFADDIPLSFVNHDSYASRYYLNNNFRKLSEMVIQLEFNFNSDYIKQSQKLVFLGLLQNSRNVVDKQLIILDKIEKLHS